MVYIYLDFEIYKFRTRKCIFIAEGFRDTFCMLVVVALYRGVV